MKEWDIGQVMVESTTIEIAVDDTTAELSLPDGVIEMFTGEGQEPADAVADLLTMAYTERLHGAVAHSAEEPSDALAAIEANMRDRFEERFGATFAEVTGHQH